MDNSPPLMTCLVTELLRSFYLAAIFWANLVVEKVIEEVVNDTNVSLDMNVTNDIEC